MRLVAAGVVRQGVKKGASARKVSSCKRENLRRNRKELGKHHRGTFQSLQCLVVPRASCVLEDEAGDEIKQQWPKGAKERVRMRRREE
jgi:hypothetical protein